jgi:hypothetical protein
MHEWIIEAGKRNLVLLGAGNSAAAGLPTSKQLAAMVLEQAEKWHAPYAEVMQTIADEADRQELNVEELHGLVVRKAELGILTPEPTNPTVALNRAQIASELIVHSVQQILDDSSIEAIGNAAFMSSLLTDSVQTIVSLNYDQLLEVVASSSGSPVSTDAELWDGSYNWPPNESKPRYLKIHGSLDWRSHAAMRVINSENPFLTPRIVAGKTRLTSDNKTAQADASLIFGGVNKLTSWGPYPALMNAFREDLNHARTVTVIGYAFGDDHVNQALIRWMSLSEDHRLIVVDYEKPTQEFGFFSEYFWLDQGVNLPFYEEYLRAHVEFIRGDARTVVPEIFGETN